MTEPLDTVIALFVKEPRRGSVKSRLAAVLGEDAALGLYRCFVLDLLDTLDGSGLPVRIFVHPPEGLAAVSGWLGVHRRYRPQQGADLGERMANAFRGIFAEGASRAALIGSDLPDLPPEIPAGAVAALEHADAVLGPAKDGGYYLVGFRREGFRPDIFQGIPWGGAAVFELTRELLRGSGASVRFMPTWSDVDTVMDLKELVQRSRGTAFAESRTIREAEKLIARPSGPEDRHA